MHTRRISAFLVGAWMAVCLVIDLFSIESIQVPVVVLSSPLAPVAKDMEKLGGYDETAQLLRHASAEMNRLYVHWGEEAEILLALALGGCLFLATQRRVFPLVLGGLMLVLVVFQYLAISPELTYRGREADFPPGSLALATVTRVMALQQVYVAVEVVKLIVAGLLASYLFVFRTSGRTRSRKEVHAVDHADDRHVDR